MRSDTTPTAGYRRGDRLLTRLTVADLMPWPAYRAAPHAGRQSLIEHRRERSVALGPCMRLQFEDALTISHQIQEVFYIERMAGLDAMQHEIDTYAPLLAGGTNWKATLMIELPDAEELAAELQRRPAGRPEPLAGESSGSADDMPARLDDQAVLCVGGRPASVPVYRQLIERTGGRFLHHDGCDEGSVAKLDATLAAADLVICQTGCVSHDAYWRVKDHCKRTGKRRVFVEIASGAGLKRALLTRIPVPVGEAGRS